MSCDHARSAILYIIFTLASLPSTAVVAKLGVKASLVIASIPYILNILQLQEALSYQSFLSNLTF